MKLTKAEAQERFPGAIFYGDVFYFGDGVNLGDYVKLGNDVRLGNGVSLGNDVSLGNGVSLGDYVSLGNGVRLGNGVSLGNYVSLGDGVSLGNGVRLPSIYNKYFCNIVPNKSLLFNVRIGCELHTIPEWEEQKEVIADKNDRKWWDESGQYIYEFLKGEAERYTKRYQK